jgi:hypothetical protein
MKKINGNPYSCTRVSLCTLVELLNLSVAHQMIEGAIDVVGVKVDHSKMVVGGILCGCLSGGNSEGLG